METRYCDSGVSHVFEPDNHLCCKLRYWREGSGVAVGYTYGRQNFHGPTNKERLDRAKAEARANGYEPVQVSKPYAGPVSV